LDREGVREGGREGREGGQRTYLVVGGGYERLQVAVAFEGDGAIVYVHGQVRKGGREGGREGKDVPGRRGRP